MAAVVAALASTGQRVLNQLDPIALGYKFLTVPADRFPNVAGNTQEYLKAIGTPAGIGAVHVTKAAANAARSATLSGIKLANSTGVQAFVGFHRDEAIPASLRAAGGGLSGVRYVPGLENVAHGRDWLKPEFTAQGVAYGDKVVYRTSLSPRTGTVLLETPHPVLAGKTQLNQMPLNAARLGLGFFGVVQLGVAAIALGGFRLSIESGEWGKAAVGAASFTSASIGTAELIGGVATRMATLSAIGTTLGGLAGFAATFFQAGELAQLRDQKRAEGMLAHPTQELFRQGAVEAIGQSMMAAGF
jgi:hypothetical protein